MQLTILMPCLNEAETLAICIQKARSWIDRANVSAEIVIADNGSTDDSRSIALENGARVVDVVEKGYGSALWHGTCAAKGEFIIMGDADDSYDFSDLDNFWLKLSEGYDLVMGNRFLGGIEPGAMPWKNRYIGNPVLTWIGKLLFQCPSDDFHCGLRGFKKESFYGMDLRTTGMEYASEMVIKANLMSMKITEVPTTLSKDGRSRAPHLNPWRDGWRHLKFMLLFSPRWLLFYPGSLVLIVSSLLYALTIIGPIRLANISLDTNTMFYSSAGIVIGALAVCFGVMIRLFGAREGLFIDTSFAKWLRRTSLMELGVLIGLTGFVMGGLEAISLVLEWKNFGFGDLEAGRYLKRVSISSLAIILGALICFSSIVIGYLSLPLRRAR